MKKTAFTLAEVLITLAVIGVIAAITIPSVVANNQKREWVSALQKANSTINNALALSQAENGELTSWPWETLTNPNEYPAFMKNYILPYLKVQKDCGIATNNNCFAKGIYKNLGQDEYADLNSRYTAYRIKLQDGTSWMFYFMSNCLTLPRNCGWIEVDINGEKGPNTYGRDLFQFGIFPFTNQIAFNGIYKVSQYDKANNAWTKFEPAVNTSPFENCNPTVANGGTFCAARIQLDGWQMNY